jgi:predicted ATP-grasp superfamily ATP-dependent carboligase
VLKPAHSRPFFIRYGIKAHLAHTPNELARKYDEYLREGHPTVVQEFIPGGAKSLYFLQTCTDDGAQPMVRFVGRKIVQDPEVFGNAVVIQQADQPEIAELSRRAIQALDFKSYMAHTQFKHDPLDGQWKFLELNPRPPIGITLPTLSGVNLPFMAYRHLLDQPVPRPAVQRPGLSWIMDLSSPTGYRNLGCLLLTGRRQYFGDITCAFFSPDDVKPFFYAVIVGVCEARNRLALGRLSG